MQIASLQFKARARAKLADVKLQAALRKLQGNFVKGRADRMLEFDNFDDIRDAAAAIRNRTLANLDLYLETFERNATARGAVFCIREAAKKINLDLKGAKTVVQGYGNAGSIAARLISELGAVVIAVSDSGGGIHNPAGLDLKAVDAHKKKTGSVIGFASSAGGVPPNATIRARA